MVIAVFFFYCYAYLEVKKMKLTVKELDDYGLTHLKKGVQLYLPQPFRKDIDILFKTHGKIYAIVHERCLNDFITYHKVLMLLNQLCRYYHCPITIYCLSYRCVCSDEKIYTSFTQKPCD